MQWPVMSMNKINTSMLELYFKKRQMPFSSVRFGQFCDFRPKVRFSTSGSKRFEILTFSSGLLTLSIFFC
ncbi:hypothetical protein HanXRQr2_Chr11g0501281 [Helianthus annuus]|uniref:Uncharacterized protein n=1 Tax=Helianthus annuus TaxID=4232 RepID=A0A9K3HRC7_HELAN|nr:hypothetical protein HanXRQr2_Chr11g0501281 [Helianthus annuus]KAJ0875976.1 hypothetical protein HanPSC8_Chr11g0483081 [Helianthus annuus]